ncbi:unnamed protein product [Effrenium voratum]|nr:unnamed protein product [Effrenium voratum]
MKRCSKRRGVALALLAAVPGASLAFSAPAGHQASLGDQLNRYAELGDVANAERVFAQLHNKEGSYLRYQVNTVIKACANAGRLERAEYWHARLKDMNLEQNDKGFGKLVEAASKAGNLPKAEEYFRQLELLDGRMPTTAYNCVLAAAAKSGDLNAATRWRSRMEDQNVQPDRILVPGLDQRLRQLRPKLPSLGPAPGDALGSRRGRCGSAECRSQRAGQSWASCPGRSHAS